MTDTFENTFENWIAEVTSDYDTETRWLNLLSQLEYVGCRKILKSVPYDRVDADVLQHIQEEALHAHLLKQLVLRRGGRAQWEEESWSQAGWEYIQSVDRQVCESTGSEEFYPLVSWVIEQRVLWLYPWYLDKTTDAGVKRVLSTILAQEKRHASQFDEYLFSEAAQARALKIEQTAWARLTALLAASPNAAAVREASLTEAARV